MHTDKQAPDHPTVPSWARHCLLSGGPKWAQGPVWPDGAGACTSRGLCLQTPRGGQGQPAGRALAIGSLRVSPQRAIRVRSHSMETMVSSQKKQHGGGIPGSLSGGIAHTSTEVTKTTFSVSAAGPGAAHGSRGAAPAGL